MNIFKKGAFTYDQNMTPQQLADKRAMLAMLQPKYGKASYIGEGLGQLATGVATGIRTRKLDEIEGKGRDQGADLFSSLFGGTTQSTSGQSGPMNILGVDPIALPDPSSPEGIANDTMAVLGKNVDFTPGDRESFIKAMTPHAMRVAEITGLDPRLVIAQAAQETGWGKSAPNNNFFGIKSHGKGGGGTFATTEYIGGKPVTVNDSFRGYSDMGDSAMGYAQFLMENPRYKAMLAAGDLDGQLAALGESGYATDPNYASSVGSIARGISLGGPVAAPAGASTATNSAMPSIDPQALAAALANPWLSPEERSVLTTIYDQQVQAGDPLRQIEVAKGMAELDKMNAPPAPPEDFTTRIFLAQQAGLEPGTPEFQTYLLTGKLPDEVGSNVPAAFASLDLQAKAAGFEPGTPEYQEFMRNGGGSGTPAAFTALDLQAKAAGFEPGTPQYQEFMATRGAGFIAAAKAKGEDAATAESLGSKMPGLEEVVQKLDELSEKATYTYGGQALDWSRKQLGMDPREAAVARSEYIAMVDNQVLPLLRDTFGAQFTQAEGETLRNTLGDPDKSPTEKQAVLKAFIEQKRRDIEALNVRTGRDAAPAAGGGTTRKRYNPATGAFE